MALVVAGGLQGLTRHVLEDPEVLDRAPRLREQELVLHFLAVVVAAVVVEAARRDLVEHLPMDLLVSILWGLVVVVGR